MREGVKLGFTTLDQELNSEVLNIKGKLPKWLTGAFFRNGPAKFEVKDEKYLHWFDGLAMIVKFSFQDNKILYSNRYLHSKAFTNSKDSGHIYYPEFATNPTSSLRYNYMKFTGQLTDNASVNFFEIGNNYVAMTETHNRLAFDPFTLETLGKFKYDDNIWGHLTTAHPHISQDGEIYNYITTFSLTSKYKIFRIKPGSKKREVFATIPAKEPSYMHSFSITENFLILAEYPLVIEPLYLLSSNKPMVDNLHWKPEKGVLFTIINRKNGSIVGRYQADPFFAFHHINAYEEKDRITIDLIVYRDASLAKALYIEDLINPNHELPVAEVRRYYLYTSGNKMPQYEVVSNQFPEFPRINYHKLNTKKYRFVYGICPYKSNGFNNSIIKLDMMKKDIIRWYEKDCYPGEAVFIPHPEGKEEDDGVLLSVVLDINKTKSFLLILDAHTFKEVARAEIPHPIPFGSHCQYFEI